jgi:hypothetical protein
MRRNTFATRSLVVALSLVAVAGCSTIQDVGGYTVTYRSNVTGIATIDSALYDRGNGTFQKVTAPAANWFVSVTVKPGGSVGVQLYGAGTAAGTAQLTAIWMTATGDVSGDSVTATTAAATKFTATVANRTL